MNLKSILILTVSAAFCAVADPCPMCPQSTNGWYSAGPCPHMFAAQQTGGSIEWKMVNRYEQSSTNFAPDEAYASSGWRGGAPAHDIWLDREVHSVTGRIRSVKQFLPHSGSMEFFLSHMQRQYSNDMRTVTGRVKWHGKPVRQEIDATNRMCKIERYADGTVHVEPFAPPKPRGVVTNSPAWKKKAAARRAAIQARRNVLPGLKDAQLKAHDAKHSVSNVTVNVTIGK